jgi:2-methylcitrate dehydratase PrpD
MATALTAGLARFIADLRYEDIPAEAREHIAIGFTDCSGVMIAGSREESVRILTSTLSPARGEATLVFGPTSASALEAALINATAAHALDYDDVAQRGHPSAVLVPAILAEAQALGASGKDMIVAYAAGYETWAELVRRDLDQHHDKGWHPTGIFGAIGAAAACASLRKLDAERAAHAIALGASQSAGVMANFGTMTKPFHAGRSAQAGVLAARLAANGFTASPDAFEHPQGFLSAVSPKGRFDIEKPVEAGIKWKILKDKLGVKKYPLCYCTHRALDAVLDLDGEQQIDPAKVNSVTVSTSRLNTKILRNHLPQTGLEAKFSMEFAMASALVAKRAGLAELTDDFVLSPEVQALMKRVTVQPDDREDPEKPGKSPYDMVIVETFDNRRLESAKVKHIRGGPELPLKREELWTKFEGCLQTSPRPFAARDLFDALMSLEKVTHVNQLPGLGSSPRGVQERARSATEAVAVK